MALVCAAFLNSAMPGEEFLNAAFLLHEATLPAGRSEILSSFCSWFDSSELSSSFDRALLKIDQVEGLMKEIPSKDSH